MDEKAVFKNPPLRRLNRFCPKSKPCEHMAHTYQRSGAGRRLPTIYFSAGAAGKPQWVGVQYDGRGTY